MRCPHCYQKDYSGYSNVIDKEKAFEALYKIKPETIIMYGGEPMLFPNIVKDFFNEFEDKSHMIIATNGTIWNKELYDRAYMIMVTLESFFFNYSNNRKYTKAQYNNLMKIIRTYKYKLNITHNLYPKNNDSYFYRMIQLGDFNSGPYPIVDYCEEADYEPEVLKEYDIDLEPLINPKLRILTDGTITKDMRGVYNLCSVDEWEDEYKNAAVPVHEKCISCKYNIVCPSYKMFPHFCKDVLDKIEDPHFCKIARWIYVQD